MGVILAHLSLTAGKREERERGGVEYTRVEVSFSQAEGDDVCTCPMYMIGSGDSVFYP